VGDQCGISLSDRFAQTEGVDLRSIFILLHSYQCIRSTSAGSLIGRQHFPEATELQYALVGGLSISLAMLSAPIANWISRRYHYKLTMAIGLVLQGGSFLLASWATRVLPIAVPGIPADRDMAIIPYSGGNVWNWHGFVVRSFGTPAQSMVQQTPSIGDGNLCCRVRTRRPLVLHLH